MRTFLFDAEISLNTGRNPEVVTLPTVLLGKKKIIDCNREDNIGQVACRGQALQPRKDDLLKIIGDTVRHCPSSSAEPRRRASKRTGSAFGIFAITFKLD